MAIPYGKSDSKASHRLLQEVDWVDWGSESPEAASLDWLRARVGPETLIVQNLCGWQGHDANLSAVLILTVEVE